MRIGLLPQKLWRTGLAAMMLLPVLPAADTADQAQPARSLVTLVLTGNSRNGCGSSKLDFARVLPDGATSSDPFRVPDGQLLVVTDVDWLYSNGGPGLTEVLLIAVENLADSGKRQTAFHSAIRLGPDGAGGASEHLTTGFLISAAARPCADVAPFTVGAQSRLSSVVLRGYLVSAR